jgi:hypothetical protein
VGQGDLFAITRDQMHWLLSQSDDGALFDSIHSIEETCDDEHRLPLWKEGLQPNTWVEFHESSGPRAR